MAGLVPAIHVFAEVNLRPRRFGPISRGGGSENVVDGQVKPGDDGNRGDASPQIALVRRLEDVAGRFSSQSLVN